MTIKLTGNKPWLLFHRIKQPLIDWLQWTANFVSKPEMFWTVPFYNLIRHKPYSFWEMYRVWIVFLSRNNFYCKTSLNRLEDNLRYSMITLFNDQSHRIFHQCSSFPVQQRAPSHSRALTSHDGARRPWHMVSLAENGCISKLKLHQTVSAAAAVRLASLRLRNLPCWDITH